MAGEKAYVAKLQDDYGYQAVEWIGREALQARIGTDRYYGGRLDHGAGISIR